MYCFLCLCLFLPLDWSLHVPQCTGVNFAINRRDLMDDGENKTPKLKEVFGSGDEPCLSAAVVCPPPELGHVQTGLSGVLSEEGWSPHTICLLIVSLWFLTSPSLSLSLLLAVFISLPVPGCVSEYQIKTLSLGLSPSMESSIWVCVSLSSCLCSWLCHWQVLVALPGRNPSRTFHPQHTPCSG